MKGGKVMTEETLLVETLNVTQKEARDIFERYHQGKRGITVELPKRTLITHSPIILLEESKIIGGRRRAIKEVKMPESETSKKIREVIKLADKFVQDVTKDIKALRKAAKELEKKE